jgi:hypothetical protein
MLVSVLNTCTKEELAVPDEDIMIMPIASPEEHAERRKIIKNKILAVGRMARVFALLRYVSMYATVGGFHPINLFVGQRGVREGFRTQERIGFEQVTLRNIGLRL